MGNETIADIGAAIRYQPERQESRPVLLTLDGQGYQEVFPLRQGETTIGRDSAATIMLRSAKVSRIHMKVLWENFDSPHKPAICHLIDNQSTNGTFLNGLRVTNRAMLTPGDIIVVGNCQLGYYLRTQAEIDADQQLRVLATRDALTGLANRAFMNLQFELEYERARRYDRPLTLLLVDLDHFKRVNDTYGHQAGDLVLQTVARALLERIRSHDIGARYGGEEFAVMLPETTKTGAAILAERLRLVIASLKIVFDEHVIPITASIGIAEIDHLAPPGLEDLIARADAALYRAKGAGRNCVSM